MQHFIDWLVRDRRGRIIVIQAPNAPLLLAVLTTLAALITPQTWFAVQFVARVCWLIWAYLEIVHGTTNIRRIFGTVTILVVIGSAYL